MLAGRSLLDVLKAFELFLDGTLSTFLVMAVFVTHKMILEKMTMRNEKHAALTRKGVVRGGGDSDSEDGDGDAPQAVPLEQQQEAAKPTVVAKAAATSSMRRRHA